MIPAKTAPIPTSTKAPILADRKQRVTSITVKIGRKTIAAPLAQVTDRRRPYVLAGTAINPNY